MKPIASRRLIDAAATLDAADRALVSMWVNRCLDDATVARLTGVTDAAIAARRVRIVEQLSTELGLDPEHVHETLLALAVRTGDPGEGLGTRAEPVAPPSATPLSVAPPSVAPPSATPPSATPPSATRPPVDSTPGRAADERSAPGRSASPGRRRLWLSASLLTLAAATVLVLALASGGHARHQRLTAASLATRSTTPPVSAAGQTSAAARTADRLAPVLGGPANVTGTVAVTGQGASLRLNVSVSGMPALRAGHYELWLFRSMVYSQPLGAVPAGVSHSSLRLSGSADAYPWIDISYQPAGSVYHSGDSLVRAANPLFTSRAAGG